jgi:hypothetical protein
MKLSPYIPTLLKAWHPITGSVWPDKLHAVKKTFCKFTEVLTAKISQNTIEIEASNYPWDHLDYKIAYSHKDVKCLNYSGCKYYALPINLLVLGKDGKAYVIKTNIKLENYNPELYMVPENQLEMF